RDQDGFSNLITDEQQSVALTALEEWSRATNGQVAFIRDTNTPTTDILNIGVGDLAAFGMQSAPGGTLGVGGGNVSIDADDNTRVRGIAWLDSTEDWDTGIGNGNPTGTHDFFTVVAHEVGHVLGYADAPGDSGITSGVYNGERTADTIVQTVAESGLPIAASGGVQPVDANFDIHQMLAAQLTTVEVEQILVRASAATPSTDAIIAIVDRGGNILGVRTEDGVVAPNNQVLSFMIDGAVAKARTAAFFSNGDPENGTLAPLTSRTVRFISQSTVTEREVESDPNHADPTLRGPGFVAPIGLGGHFPPEVFHTPPVDLFAIEHTNRDSLIHAGPNGIREGVAVDTDDIMLTSRFNADFIANQEVNAPESYGLVSGLAPTQQSRGIATLPGGIPIFRDTNGDGAGDTLIGGIGVFFPGPDGFATHEQGFVPGIGQTEAERTNASRVLEAEYIAFAALGGSSGAQSFGANGARIGDLGGKPAIADLDLPFGELTLVGITLEGFGPIAGIEGVRDLIEVGNQLGQGTVNGTNRQVTPGGDLFVAGDVVPEDWLVAPKDGVGITAAEVRQIIEQGRDAAEVTRAAVRLPVSSRTRMVFSVTDKTGEVLGLFRMKDATFFSIDVAVAKARNTAYYADAAALDPDDQVPGVAPGVAFSNRTFRFLAEPRFPSGVEGSNPPEFSILNNPNINPATAENIGAAAPDSAFDDTVLGYDAFNPATNFQDTSSELKRQNGVVFFP
ncbi:MAG: matrixin family metalloprotease, partial [Planctomycetaceae bacterium]